MKRVISYIKDLFAVSRLKALLYILIFLGLGDLLRRLNIPGNEDIAEFTLTACFYTWLISNNPRNPFQREFMNILRKTADAEFPNEHVAYDDEIRDYSTNEPTMDGTAGAIFMMAWFGESLTGTKSEE